MAGMFAKPEILFAIVVDLRIYAIFTGRIDINQK
jgi:hypothetical protein